MEQELSDDGLSLKEGMKPQQVAGTAYEGTYIHKRGGYYYLFASIGRCCEGFKEYVYHSGGAVETLIWPLCR